MFAARVSQGETIARESLILPPPGTGRAMEALRSRLEIWLGDRVYAQDLLLLLVCAKAIDEPREHARAFDDLPGDRPGKAAERLNKALGRAYLWLERVTGEVWPRVVLPRMLVGAVFDAFQDVSVLRGLKLPGAPERLGAVLEAIAGPEGRLLEGSLFARDSARIRLIDVLAFKKPSRRVHILVAVATRAFALRDDLKRRNLDHMRGNYKRGDLFLGNYPKLIHVELATACNLRCRTCSITRPGRMRQRTFLPLEVLERLRPALAFISDCKLHGGGEPFLHPQIERVLEVFLEEGVRLNTVTNAQVITERLGKLIGETFSTLTVSVDGGDAQTYEYVRLRSRWSKLLRGIEFINRHRNRDFKLIIGVVMLKCNIHQLPDLVRFTAEHGGQELQAAWLVPFHDLPWTKEQGLTDDPKRTNAFMDEARETGRRLGISVRIPDNLPEVQEEGPNVRLTHSDTYWDLHGTNKVDGHCRLMYDRAMILVDGRVKPCGQSRMVPRLGSIRDRSFFDCWNGSGYMRLRDTFNGGTLPKTCQSCNFIRSKQLGPARLVY